MKCSAAAMALCPDRIMCCTQKHPGEFAVGSECYRFNESIEGRFATEKLELMLSQMCDHYCRFPRECDNEDELMEHCEDCPLAGLL